MKILFLDDEMPILETLKFAFSPCSYDCIYTQYPLEALELLQNEHFDLLVSDFNMPRMNGIEVLKRIKRDDMKTEVIIITGYADVSNAIDAVNFGAYAFFRKPLNIKELLTTIQGLESRLNCKKENELDIVRFRMEYRKLKQTYLTFMSNLLIKQEGDKNDQYNCQ